MKNMEKKEKTKTAKACDAPEETESAKACEMQEEVMPEAETSDDAGEEQALERHEHRERKRDERERPEVEGILDMADGGFGFLRFNNFLTSKEDVYVSPTQIRRFNLKTGDKIKGISRLPNEGEKFGALLYVLTVNDDEPGVAMRRPDFDKLTPIFPNERITLENSPQDLSTRLIDLIAPIDL